ncbi:MAG: HD domain-containing protein [Patescibacteria group bacterium]
MSTETIGREEFEKMLQFKMSPENLKLVKKAYRMSKYGHKGQERQSGERYFEHPKTMALILINEFQIYDHEMIIAALLHDGVEDSFIFGTGNEAFDEIEKEFGKRPAQFVALLTKARCEENQKSQRDCGYYNALYDGPAEAKVLKLVDRIHNLRTLKDCDIKKQERQLLETSMCVWRIAESIAKECPDVFSAFSQEYQDAKAHFDSLRSTRSFSNI